MRSRPTQRPAPRFARVLFLTPYVEDYLADGLLHGLRCLLGDGLVDYPKHELLYDTASADALAAAYGHGFSLYGRLPDIHIHRAGALEDARNGGFDLVVIGSINRTFGSWVELADALPHTPIAVLDGEDGGGPFPYRGRYWRRPYLWTLPRAHRRATYFKRELTPETYSYRCFRLIPGALAVRLPLMRGLEPLAFSIPADIIVDHLPDKQKDFAAHVVDHEVGQRIPYATLGAAPGAKPEMYAFACEADYYDDLRASRFGITTKRGGWDSLRHYEFAANGCVPCFRNLNDKPAMCAPHGLQHGLNCLVYHDADDLFAQIAKISNAQYGGLQARAVEWARANSTVARARGFLARVPSRVAERGESDVLPLVPRQRLVD